MAVLGPPSLLSPRLFHGTRRLAVGYSRYGGPVEVEEGEGSGLGVGFGEELAVGLLCSSLNCNKDFKERLVPRFAVSVGPRLSSWRRRAGSAGAAWLVPLASWSFW